MVLTIYRRYLKDGYTIGDLYRFDRVLPLCNTLEDTVRELVDINDDGDFDDPGEGKIYGQTAIPCGHYEIELRHSPHFGRDMLYLNDVKGFTDIMVHAGNFADDTKGCILVGENRVKGKVVNSRYWEAVIKNIIRDDEDNGLKSYIIIKQNEKDNT